MISAVAAACHCLVSVEGVFCFCFFDGIKLPFDSKKENLWPLLAAFALAFNFFHQLRANLPALSPPIVTHCVHL
jgi:hypothetical protein